MPLPDFNGLIRDLWSSRPVDHTSIDQDSFRSVVDVVAIAAPDWFVEFSQPMTGEVNLIIANAEDTGDFQPTFVIYHEPDGFRLDKVVGDLCTTIAIHPDFTDVRRALLVQLVKVDLARTPRHDASAANDDGQPG